MSKVEGVNSTMQSKSFLKKLNEFKRHVESFVADEDSSAKSVHKLRVGARELFSLLSSKELFSKELKKIIKQSNKIRDIDVFLQSYINSLAKKDISKLHVKTIKESIYEKRDKMIKEFHKYLKSLSIPKSVLFQEITQPSAVKKVEITELNKKRLHKYRIYIKKILYIEKNSPVVNQKKVRLLSKIKDLLGEINDNYNGLKILRHQNVKPKLLKKIQKNKKMQNLKIFKEFKKIQSEV